MDTTSKESCCASPVAQRKIVTSLISLVNVSHNDFRTASRFGVAPRLAAYTWRAVRLQSAEREIKYVIPNRSERGAVKSGLRAQKIIRLVFPFGTLWREDRVRMPSDIHVLRFRQRCSCAVRPEHRSSVEFGRYPMFGSDLSAAQETPQAAEYRLAQMTNRTRGAAAVAAAIKRVGPRAQRTWAERGVRSRLNSVFSPVGLFLSATRVEMGGLSGSWLSWQQSFFGGEIVDHPKIRRHRA